MNNNRGSLPYGIYRMRLVGPAAALDALGRTTVRVKGDDLDNLVYDASEAVARLANPSAADEPGTSHYDNLPEIWCPLEFAEPVLTANEWQNPDGTQQWFVGVYLVDRCYGGPEEGGWWYDAGELVRQTAVATRADAEALRTKLADRYPRTGASSNVHGGEDYAIHIDLQPHAEHYPTEHPRYE
jgi:hypothetical protein